LDAPVEILSDSLVPFDLGLTEDQAVTHALADREELAEAGAGVQAARAGVRLASASFLPTLSVAVDYGFQGRNIAFDGHNDYAVASVGVSGTLFRGGSDAARGRGAQDDGERPTLRRRELDDLIRLDVRRA